MDLMIKPVSGHCNLNCRYCFYKKDHEQNPVMQPGQAVLLLEKLLPLLKHGIPLIFQGGEPLLAGYDYFAQVFSWLKAHNISSPLGVQTNGTLLTPEFARLFAQNGVLLGVSLDGDKASHQSGRECFDQVMAGIDCLRAEGCEWNILSVLTDSTASRAEENWRFFREQKFDFQQYIPCMNTPDGDPYEFLSEEAYGDFLCRLYNLWKKDYQNGRYVYIRFFENLFLLLSGQNTDHCGANGICGKQMLIESDGDVYPCDFYVTPGLRLGNLYTDSLKDMMNQPLEEEFILSSFHLPDECGQCEYLHFCRGGCRRYRGRDERFLYCKAYRKFFRYALRDMQKLIAAAF